MKTDWDDLSNKINRDTEEFKELEDPRIKSKNPIDLLGKWMKANVTGSNYFELVITIAILLVGLATGLELVGDRAFVSHTRHTLPRSGSSSHDSLVCSCVYARV